MRQMRKGMAEKVDSHQMKDDYSRNLSVPETRLGNCDVSVTQYTVAETLLFVNQST